MLVDPSNNSLMGYVKVSLAEAEAFGWRRPKLPEEWAAMAASSQDASAGKQVRQGAPHVLSITSP